MKREKLKLLVGTLSFPLWYFVLSTLSSYFLICELGRYEPKDGQWNSFKLMMLLHGVFNLVTSTSYLIGIGLKSENILKLSFFSLSMIACLSVLVLHLGWLVLSQIRLIGDWSGLGLLFIAPLFMAYTVLEALPDKQVSN